MLLEKADQLAKQLLALLGGSSPPRREGLLCSSNSIVQVLGAGNGDIPQLLASGRVDTVVDLVRATVLAVDDVVELLEVESRDLSGRHDCFVCRGIERNWALCLGGQRPYLSKLELELASGLCSFGLCSPRAPSISSVVHELADGAVDNCALGLSHRQHLPHLMPRSSKKAASSNRNHSNPTVPHGNEWTAESHLF